jgi:glutathione synthase/RimK-type ligase-like ATP-grasp enzyme
MNITFLCARNGWKTLKLICKKIKELNPDITTGIHREFSGSRFVNSFHGTPQTPYIRWATTRTVAHNTHLNPAESIALASNKKLAQEEFLLNGIPTPLIVNQTNHFFPIIIRPLKHRGGQDFYVCHSELDAILAISDLQKPYYIQRYYPKQNEYRVHCAHGKILLMQEKEGDKENNIIWNHQQSGFKFKYIKWSDYPRGVALAGLRAVSALGLDYGAADVMANPKDESLPSVMVSEVNTSPTLYNYSAERYAKYFIWYTNTLRLDNLYPGERTHDPTYGSPYHWEFENIENTRDLAWKNKELKPGEENT